MMTSLAKNWLPKPLFNWLKAKRDARRRATLKAAGSRAEIFSAVYREKMWGGSGEKFHSGWGSHRAAVVEPYVTAVSDYLQSLPTKPDVCDLGCGDFAVGVQLRPYCDRYIACDIVPELVERNRKQFADCDVDFRTLDLVTDPLPEAQVLLVRQVFQHLSNGDIAATLPKLKRYRAIIATEDVPDGEFEPNHDKPAGFDVRLSTGSGVDLAAPPFNFEHRSSRVLCRATHNGQVLLTTLYEPL
ncbi:class I SAM-dependent methyltransferase [Aurantiacibacter sp. MUD61]|uniref:class I SAM-dependent methyltransferase n=1 Tax=Aurantiacibacter sp. MUD61 TaxID=3009083 RepID=UPI0022F08DC3|nr:class I SAM-dependent methyltransferase [Aurantiacibacter sp. MUD61]